MPYKINFAQPWFRVRNCIPLPEINLISILLYQEVRHPVQTDVSQISLLLTPLFSITSRHSAITLLQCSHGIPPTTKDCLILQVSLQFKSAMLIWSDVCATISVWGPHIWDIPPVLWLQCSLEGEWFLLSQQRRKTPIAGNGSFTDYASGLSIKSNNYILPYSLQILTLLLLLDDNLWILYNHQ
jgi:hypothetical protein